jgi:hypothetical protein
MHSTDKAIRRARPCALALVAALSMPVVAQTTGTGSAGTSTTAGTTEVRRDRGGFDWGWLGLIGLAGLLGRRKPSDVTRVDTTRTNTQR